MGRLNASSFRQAALLLCLALAAAQPAAAARWYEDYQHAVERIEAGGCSEEAINYLGAAVVDKPKPRLAARTFAARTIDYLPYYQLARAHLACGNLANARENLAKSRQWGVAGGDDLERLEDRIRKVEASRATPTPAPVDADELEARHEDARRSLEEADAALSRCNSAIKEARGLRLDTTTWVTIRDRAVALLERARRAARSGAAEQDLLKLADADRLAKDVALQLVDLAEGVRGAVADHRAALATPTPAPTATVKPTPPVASPPPQPTPTPLVAPAPLRRAAAQYFDRNYHGVVETLSDAAYPVPKLRAAALLLRGAARLALARLAEGDSADRLTDTAHADLASARKTDPTVQPDPRFFPPSVVEAWNDID